MTTILPNQEDGGVGWMHIYEQEMPHAPCWIRGNRKALEQLRAAIDMALSPVGIGKASVFARDGEGYSIEIDRVSILDALKAPPYVKPSRW